MRKNIRNQLTEVNKVFIFYSLTVHRIVRCFETFDNKELKALDDEIEKELSKYEFKISPYQRIILYYFLGMSNFIRNNFEKSIYWMGKIINFGSTDLSQDYQCYSRIVYLICYYELGYYDSMEYVLKSVYHFLSKKERVYKYENIILKYLRKSFRVRSNEELNEMFIDMKSELELIKNDPYEQNAFDAFNILYWLESKIKKITIAEAIQMSR